MLRYTARVFGFAKLGKQIDAALRYVIEIAAKNGEIKREDGRVKVV